MQVVALVAAALVIAIATQPQKPSEAAGLSVAAQVATAGKATCALNNAGKIFCWGRNNVGQLGDGTTTDRATPAEISNPQSEGAKTYSKIAAGSNTFCAISGTSLYCWGANNTSQIGDGTQTNRSIPTRVTTDGYKAVTLGANHTCAIRSDDQTMCWGSQQFYQVGNNVQSDSSPQATPLAISSSFTSISAGADTTCGLTSAGAAYCWGLNSHGQAGNGSIESNPDIDPPTIVNAAKTPTLVSGGITFKASSLSGGGRTFCGIQSSDSAVFCWGRGTGGAVGDGAWLNRTAPTATQLPDASAFKAGQVHAMYSAVCALSSVDNRLYCWGNNSFYQFGNNSTTATNQATVVAGDRVYRSLTSSSHDATQCGFEAANDGLYCWGSNGYSQAGSGTSAITTPTRHMFDSARTLGGVQQYRNDGTTTLGVGLTASSPVFKATLTSLDAADSALSLCVEAKPIGTAFDGTNNNCSATVASGATASVTLSGLNAGSYHWRYQVQSTKYGYSPYQPFGGNDEIAADFVVGSEDTTDIGQWIETASTGNSTCAINHAGKVFCWGLNASGQLGNNNNTTSSALPVAVNSALSFRALSGGEDFMCGLSGTDIYCWGSDTLNALGDGVASTTSVSSPQLVVGSHKFVSVSAGFASACGLDIDGIAWCWGRNLNGELGIGASSNDNPTPQRALSPVPLVQVALTTFSVNARDESGTLYTWGSDSYGLLGNGAGSTSDVTVPQAIDTGHTYAALTETGNHACAIEASTYNVWCWGYNGDGQVGAKTDYANKPSPTQVKDANNAAFTATSLTGGELSTCAISRANSQLYCWGRNGEAQLGNGTITSIDYATLGAGGMYARKAGSGSTSWHTCAMSLGTERMSCWGENSEYGVSPIAGNKTSPVRVPFLSSEVAQSPALYKSDGTTTLGVGGTTVTPQLKATLTTVDTTNDTQMKLCAEVKPVGTAFTGTFAYCSATVANNALATITMSGLSVGAYHLRYRVESTYYGITTSRTWGANDESATDVVIAASEASGASQAKEVITGVNSTCALDAEGNAFCWGNNANKQLGSDVAGSTATPTLVSGGHKFSQIVSGGINYCGLEGGTAYCWGVSTYGILGDSSVTVDTATPVAVVGNHSFASLAGGGTFVCGIDTDGRAWCWGQNELYQLGNGTTSPSATPIAVGGSVNFREVVALEGAACGRDVSNTIWCWGSNYFGQTGQASLGAGSYTTVPTPISSTRKFSKLGGSRAHICGIEVLTNEVFCWGQGDMNQLGNGNAVNSYIPVGVTITGTTSAMKATDLVGINQTSCARSNSDQRFYCWGAGNHGEFGDGSTNTYSNATPAFENRILRVIRSGTNTEHSCAFEKASDFLYCWGENDDRMSVDSATDPITTLQMNMFASARTTLFPKQYRSDGTTALPQIGIAQSAVEKATLTSSDAADTSLSLCLEVKAVDTAFDGQNETCSATEGIGSLASVTLNTLGDGQYHWRYRVVSTKYGAGMYTPWGFNGEGEPDLTIQSTNDGAHNAQWAQVTTSGQSTCALNREGQAFCWGSNASGQLGNGTTTNSASPVAVLGNHVFTQISGGDGTFCGLEGTSVWCWGENGYAQTGSGTTGSGLSTPVQVIGGDEFVALSLGGWRGCGLLSNQSVKCWGENDLYGGGTGSNTPDPNVAPTSISFVSPLIQVGSGDNHSCARDAADNLFCWGVNDYGQVGNGTNEPGNNGVTTANKTPRMVVGGRQYAGFALGLNQTCAIESGTNKVFCWGSNEFGQLGNGNTGTGASSGTPVSVLRASDSTALVASNVTVGHETGCARNLGANTFQCWGHNYGGQYGNGDTTLSSKATSAFGGLSFRRAVASAPSHRLCGFRLSDDALLCWGDNSANSAGYGGSNLLSPTAHPFLSGASSAQNQYRQFDNSTVAVGAYGNTMQFKASMSTLQNAANAGAAADTNLRFCVEIKPVGTAFDGASLDCGTAVSDTGESVLTKSGLAENSYHWRYTTSSAHGYARFAAFGGNAESAADFIIDATAPTIASLSQRKLDYTTVIGTGEVTGENAVVARAWVTDAASQIRFCVEKKLVSTAFDGFGTECSASVASGNYAFATMSLSVAGGYHWRAWSQDEAGNISTVYSYIGATYENQADFGWGITAPSVASLTQTRADNSAITTGGYVNADAASKIKFNATKTSGSGTTSALQVEYKTSASFDGTSLVTGTQDATASQTVLNAASLTNGASYYWRMRAISDIGIVSSWTVFNASNIAFVVDNAAPSAGVVYDGATAGVQEGFNNGSYDVLSANWSGFADAIEPANVLVYEYAIGRTAGGVDVRGWTNVGNATSVTATGLTGLNTSEIYYIAVRASDLAGNVSATAVSPGQRLAPSLSFTASTATIDFGQLTFANSMTAERSADFVVSTNGYNGYLTSVAQTSLMSSASASVPQGTADVANTKADPGYGLHVTSPDTLVNGVNRFQPATCPGDTTARPAHGCWASLSASAIDVVDHEQLVTAAAPVVNETSTIWFRLQVPTLQPAGSYANSVNVSVHARF